MKQIARRYVYWLSIDADIKKLVKSCKTCLITQKFPEKAPLHKWEESIQNFVGLHMDYADSLNGNHFLIVVDAKLVQSI